MITLAIILGTTVAAIWYLVGAYLFLVDDYQTNPHNPLDHPRDHAPN